MKDVKTGTDLAEVHLLNLSRRQVLKAFGVASMAPVIGKLGLALDLIPKESFSSFLKEVNIAYLGRKYLVDYAGYRYEAHTFYLSKFYKGELLESYCTIDAALADLNPSKEFMFQELLPHLKAMNMTIEERRRIE